MTKLEMETRGDGLETIGDDDGVVTILETETRGDGL